MLNRREFMGGALYAFPQLEKTGEDFRFLINADPHVNREPHAHNRLLADFVQEVNAITPQPAFVIFNGDIYERSGVPQTTQTLLKITRNLKILPIGVTGNHDCRDFDVDQTFRPVQKAFNGTTADTFSFNPGRWHFVVVPTRELLTTPEKEQAFLDWLDRDLKANRARPTMVFMHYHVLPVGTSQLEYYTYSIDYKNRLLDTLARYGNVKYVFSGHVHAGIQPSVKTAWQYNGANFIIAPSPVKPRPFGEEYPEFTLDGGYYTIVDVKGDNVRLEGRQIGRPAGHVYPPTFRELRKSTDPRCFTPLWDLPTPGPWQTPYRYIADKDPGYTWNTTGDRTAQISVREKGQGWAVGEFTELYKIISTPAGAPPVLSLKYNPRDATRGGGYIWLGAFRGKEARSLMFFHWGPKMAPRHALRRTIAYLLTAGEERAAQRQNALYWSLPPDPNRWHDLTINLAQAMDDATAHPGAFQALGIDRLILGIGAWCATAPGSKSTARFDDIALSFPPKPGGMVLDGQPFNPRHNGLNLIVEPES